MTTPRNKVSPLDWKTPLVNPDSGTPTLQFIRLWQQLFVNEQGTYAIASAGPPNGTYGDVTVSTGPIWTVNSAVGGKIPFFSTATGNIGIGTLALNAATGINNIAIGPNAGKSLTTGTLNVAIGYEALFHETTGSNNVAIGEVAGVNQNGASSNMLLGASAGAALTTGGSNVVVGYAAMADETTGGSNVVVGANAGRLQAGVSNTTAIGFEALFNNISGTQNVAVGQLAGFDVTTGGANTLIGRDTGRGITTGGNNTVIGANVTGLAAATANNVILADGAGNKRFWWDGSHLNLYGNVVVSLTIAASNLSGTNTGDETGAGILTKLSAPGGTVDYLRADGTWAAPSSSQPFGFAFGPKIPNASKILAMFDTSIAWTMPVSLTSSQGLIVDSDTASAAAPSAQTDFDIQSPLGTSIATMRFAAGSLSATFINAVADSITIGAPVYVVAPANLNGITGAIGGSILGTRP